MKNKTYAGFSEKGKKKAEKLRVLPVAGFTSRLFACVLTLFCCVSLHAGMSPKHSDISGTTVGAAMARGDLIYHLSTPGLSCAHEPVTAFSNVYKKLSSYYFGCQ